MNSQQGKEIRFRFSSANATVAAAITLWDENGASVTLAADGKDRLHLTDVLIVCGASALTITLFDDVNANGTVDAGEELAFGDFAVNGGCAMSYITPPTCKLNSLPKIIASGAGNVKVSGTGFLTRG